MRKAPTADLDQLLRSLRLSVMAEQCAGVALKAAREGLTHEQFLLALALAEREVRDQRRTERLRRDAHLPPGKTFATLQQERFSLAIRQQVQRLKTGECLHKAVNVIVMGRPGAGKTHLVAALAQEWLLAGHALLFMPAGHMIQRLLAAKQELRLPRALAQLDKYAALILDDVGYLQKDQGEMEVLFTLLSERYERRSVVITSNLVFSDWERIFKDPMTTMAAIDRVVHHSVLLDLMNVESFRAHTAQQQADALADDADDPM